MKRSMMWLMAAALVLTWFGIACAQKGSDSTTTATPTDTTTTKTQAAAAQKDTATMFPKVKIETSMGDIVLELNAEKAPISVLNFIDYAQAGFYNGTIFHRVMPTFMIQGGGLTPDMDQKRDGLRPPIKNEWKNGLKNVKGTIAMARLGAQPDSATAQFFINVVDNPTLDQPRDGAAYAVFGKVVEGMDTVEKIRTAKCIDHPKYPGNDAVTPEEPIVIKSVSVIGGFDPAAAKAQVQKLIDEQKAAEELAKQGQAKQVEAVVQKLEAESGKKAQKTSSGLMYIMINEGEGANPKPTSSVTVHYRGVLINGTQFDSSYDRGQPATFRLNQVIPGWTEGVGLMKAGGKAKLIIPPELGYGARDLGEIPPNSWLIFDVELLKIQ